MRKENEERIFMQISTHAVDLHASHTHMHHDKDVLAYNAHTQSHSSNTHMWTNITDVISKVLPRRASWFIPWAVVCWYKGVK